MLTHFDFRLYLNLSRADKNVPDLGMFLSEVLIGWKAQACVDDGQQHGNARPKKNARWWQALMWMVPLLWPDRPHEQTVDVSVNASDSYALHW
jgi:hypothetical protein